MMLLVTPYGTLFTMTAESVLLPVNKESFFKLPRGAQLFVAYALINDLYTLELLRNDADMIALVEAGWLTVKPSFTNGIVNGDFSEKIWQGFEEIEDLIMASISEDEISRYKLRKGKAYPWLW